MTPEQEKDFALLCLNNRKALPAADEIDALRAQVERLRKALEIYASEDNWKCPRCGKKDSLNCYMGKWCGPVSGEGHGYDIARAALAETKTSTEPTKETIKK